MIEPTMALSYRMVLEAGALVALAVVGIYLLARVAKVLGDFLVAAGHWLIAKLQRDDHEHAAANEQLAHFAEEGFKHALNGDKTAAERWHELSNGGPGTGPKEQTGLLWDIRETVGRLDGKIDGLAGRVGRLEDSNVRIETRLGIGDVEFAKHEARIGRLEQAGD